MSDLRLPPKDRLAICGHLPPTHLFLLAGNVMTYGMNRKRTAQSAIHSLFLLPLCSSDTPDLPPPNFFDEEETDNPHIIDYGNRPLDSIHTESHKKAHDGTNDGKTIPT